MRSFLLAILLIASASGGSVAQPAPDITGTWSAQTPGQVGVDRVNAAYGQDGTFLFVTQMGNGSMLRQWGVYRLTPVAPGQARMDFQLHGWLPQQICAQAPGFPMRCRPNQLQTAGSSIVNMASPGAFQMDGLTMTREPSPYLLQQQVPAQLVLAAPAPVQPQMQQPVMPTLHPYVTPNGPGNATAGANHQGAKNFINGYMRGCSTAPDGRLYGCEQ